MAALPWIFFGLGSASTLAHAITQIVENRKAHRAGRPLPNNRGDIAKELLGIGQDAAKRVKP